MSNGKKNYFRHSFFAHNDIKLRRLRDAVGVGFYFYFFSLLEICGEESSDDLVDQYVFHDSLIRSLWGVNLKKSEHVASVMSAVGLLEFEKGEKTFVFRIPNFAKYLGRYTTKLISKGPNKRKEKKRKEKENKENEIEEKNFSDTEQNEEVSFKRFDEKVKTIERIINYLNKKTGAKYNPNDGYVCDYIMSHIDNYDEADFIKVIDIKCAEWLGDPEKERYLRVETLFGKKFPSYARERSFDEIAKDREEFERKADAEFIQKANKFFDPNNICKTHI